MEPEVLAKDDITGDTYQDFPDDQAPEGLSGPETLRIATEIKEFGNKAFKAKDLDLGIEKYQKALRYINEYPIRIDGDSDELWAGLNSLKFTLHSNSALLQNKTSCFRDAEESAAKALEVENLTNAEKAKAHFRRGVALAGLKDDLAAFDEIHTANKLMPGDKVIVAELKRLQKKKDDKKAKLKNYFNAGGVSA